MERSLDRGQGPKQAIMPLVVVVVVVVGLISSQKTQMPQMNNAL